MNNAEVSLRIVDGRDMVVVEWKPTADRTSRANSRPTYAVIAT